MFDSTESGVIYHIFLSFFSIPKTLTWGNTLILP